MNKKGQGLSINVIIIVAIALIVLVVLIAIFTGRMGNFVKGVDATATCKSSCEAFGMTGTGAANEAGCKGANPNNRYVPGTFRDSYITATAPACCCT